MIFFPLIEKRIPYAQHSNEGLIFRIIDVDLVAERRRRFYHGQMLRGMGFQSLN